MPASPEIEAKAEEDITPEERLEWLRARGVLVEEPASRRTKAASGGRLFKYVKIPCANNYACEEISGEAGSGDVLPSLVAPNYAGSAGVSDDAILAQAAQMGQQVGLEAMRAVMAQGGAESFRLAVPTDANGREGVYAYVDEASAMKGLPRNDRATALAHHCGFPATCILCGDIYVGRQKWNAEGLVENQDFELHDLEASSTWVRRATIENLEFQQSTQPDEHDRAQKYAVPDKPAEGAGDGYTWQDQGEEVEICVKVENGTTKKDIKVDFKKAEVRITKPLALSLKLFKAVDPDGCNWTMGKGQLILTLEKASAEAWPQLLA